jgi:hypothetical protein
LKGEEQRGGPAAVTSVHFYRNCPGKFLFGVGWSEVDIVSIILPVNIREYLGII